jgi:hypothetical protein
VLAGAHRERPVHEVRAAAATDTDEFCFGGGLDAPTRSDALARDAVVE